MKGICTECFLHMKSSHSTRPTQCPFCKTSNYAVEYLGAKTKEEKSVEQVEEQKVVEAQIRIQQQELQDEAERIKKRQDINSSSIIPTPTDVEYHDIKRAGTLIILILSRLSWMRFYNLFACWFRISMVIMSCRYLGCMSWMRFYNLFACWFRISMVIISCRLVVSFLLGFMFKTMIF